MESLEVSEMKKNLKELPELHEKATRKFFRWQGIYEKEKRFTKNNFEKIRLGHLVKGDEAPMARAKATNENYEIELRLIRIEAFVKKAEAVMNGIYERLINNRKMARIMEREIYLGLHTDEATTVVKKSYKEGGYRL